MRKLIMVMLFLIVSANAAWAGEKFEKINEFNALGMAGPSYNPSTDRIYLANFSTLTGRVSVFNTNGSVYPSFGSGLLNMPSNTAIFGNSLFVTDENKVKQFTVSGAFVKNVFSAPVSFLTGLAVDNSGKIIITDDTNRVSVYESSGALNCFAGGTGTGPDQFGMIGEVSVGLGNNIWAIDSGRNQLKKFANNCVFQNVYGQKGSRPGQFNNPFGITAYGDNILIADTLNDRIQMFDQNGQYVKSIFTTRPFDITVGGDRLIVQSTTEKISVFQSQTDDIAPEPPTGFSAVRSIVPGRIHITAAVSEGVKSLRIYRSEIGFATSAYSPDQVLIADKPWSNDTEYIDDATPGKHYFLTGLADDGDNQSLPVTAEVTTSINTAPTIKGPSSIAYSKYVKLSGILKDASGKPIPDKALIQMKPVGVTSWKNAYTVSANASGAYAVYQKPLKNTYYRLRYPGKDHLLPSYSPAILVKVKVIVTLSAPLTAKAGTDIYLTVAVAPNHAKRYAYIKIYRNGIWANLKTLTLGPTSKATFKWKVPRGTWRLKGYFPTDSDHLGIYSPEKKVKAS